MQSYDLVGSRLFTIPKLYAYSSHVRRNFAEKLVELPVDVVGKNRANRENACARNQKHTQT